MDIRKVQKVSVGTFVVSLPKRWAVKHHVKSGTMLSLTETSSGNLIVSPNIAPAEELTPQFSDEETIEESIIAAYIMGVQEVLVVINSPAMRAKALAAIQELPGMDVVEEQQKSIRIRCLLDESRLRFYSILDRLCALLRYGVDLAGVGPHSAVRQNELEINKAYHLCQRLLTRAAHDPVFLEQAGIPSSRVIPALQLLVKRLEHMGDALKDVPEKVPASARRTLEAIITLTTGMVRQFTAGKGGKLPSREEIMALKTGQTIPQVLFLVRTAEDVREELILLRTGLALEE
jgi:phosphate uptake regulator